LKTNRSTSWGEKGSETVEFALCLPVLILILCGIVEYGWYLTSQIVLTNAVSAGARAGIKAREREGEDPRDFATWTTRNAFWIGDLPDISVNINEGPPRTIEVKVASLEYSPFIGYLPPDLLPEYLNAKAVMVFP
jgi:hypothetical protein